MGHIPFRGIPLLAWTYPQATVLSGKYLLYHRVPPSPLTLLFLLFFPLLFPLPLYCLVLSTFPPPQHFLPFLKQLFTRYHQLTWWAHLWVPCKDSWKQLCPAQGSPWSPPTEAMPVATRCQNLAMYMQQSLQRMSIHHLSTRVCKLQIVKMYFIVLNFEGRVPPRLNIYFQVITGHLINIEGYYKLFWGLDNF